MENRNVFSRTGVALTLMIVLSQLTGGFLPTLLPTIFNGSIGSLLASYIGLYGIGLPILIVLTKKFESLPLKKKKALTAIEFLKLYILSLSGMYLVSILFTILLGFFTKKESNLVGNTISQLNIPQIIFLVVIFAPIAEELIFRKLFYRLFSPFGTKTYIFTSAVLFGLFHLNFSQTLYAFWLGLLLASLFYKTGNIFYPILLHMLINFTGSIVPLLLDKHSGSIVIFSLWILLTIVLGIIMLIFIFLKKKARNKKAAEQKKRTIPFKIIFMNPGMLLYVSLCLLIILIILISQFIS